MKCLRPFLAGAMLTASPIAICLCSSAVFAQTAADNAGVETVVVTAEKTGETKLQSTPASIYAFSGKELSNTMTNNVTDLVQRAPGLNVAQTSVGAQIYIRGVGTNDVFAGGDPDVTVQVDGVYIANSYAQFSDFLDVDRIEILRGPQGTLYGRNAIGGTINIISRLPTDQFEANEQLSVGNYSLVQEQAYISGPLIESKLQGSLSVNYLYHDFWSKNVFPSSVPGVDNANNGGIRGQLRFEPTPSIEAITRADLSFSNSRPDFGDHLLIPFATTPIANSTIGKNEVALDTPQWQHMMVGGISEEINDQLSDSFSLKSLSAWRYNRSASASDTDGTELPINVGHQFDTTNQFSEELNLVANLDRFTGIAGTYYFFSDDHGQLEALGTKATGDPALRVFNNLLPHVKTQSVAAFVQGTYNITDTLSAIVGLRYTVDDKSGQQVFMRYTAADFPVLGPTVPGFPFINNFSNQYHALTPKFTLNWQVTPDDMLYATVSEGYKSGGVNYAATTLAALNFRPEKLWDYEVGAKTGWFDNRMTFDVSAFWYDYSDMQVTSLLGPGIVSIGNAAKATIKGVEAELVARPVPEVSFGAKLSLLDPTYDSFPNASIPAATRPLEMLMPGFNGTSVPPTYNATGNRLNAAPGASYSLWAEWDHKIDFGSIFARAEVYHQSRVFFDPSNVAVLSQQPYTVTNLTLGYATEDGLWDVKLIGSNIFNTRYFTTMNANTTPVGFQAAPATFMVRLSRHWD